MVDFYKLYSNGSDLQQVVANCENILPGVGSDLANEITKAPYNFDFLTLRDVYDEK